MREIMLIPILEEIDNITKKNDISINEMTEIFMDSFWEYKLNHKYDWWSIHPLSKHNLVELFRKNIWIWFPRVNLYYNNLKSHPFYFIANQIADKIIVNITKEFI